MSTLQAALAAGNVIVSTTGAGTDAGNITVKDAVSWSANTLTLNATNSIFVNATMSASGTAGFTANYGSGTNADGSPSGIYMAMGQTNGVSNGTFVGKLNFSNTTPNALNIGGHAYTVVNSLSALIAAATADRTDFYALGTDLKPTTDASNYALSATPIGATSATSFNGSLDGLGHTITGLAVTTTANSAGLIGYTGSTATSLVRNIGLVDETVTITTATGQLAGGLIAANYGRISNSFASNVAVKANSFIGGLVGYNNLTAAKIYNSYATGTVTNPVGSTTGVNMGGLVGYNNQGVIMNSHAGLQGVVMVNALPSTAGSTTGGFGGLVGYNNNGTITNSWSNGDVQTAGIGNVGGLVGLNNWYISSSYATGNVTADASVGTNSIRGQNVGGLIGFLSNPGASTTIVSDSYATGKVTVTGNGQKVGGLVGQSNNGIARSRAVGEVYAPDSLYVGGLVGYNGAAVIADSSAYGKVTGKQYVGGFVGYQCCVKFTGSTGPTISDSHAYGDVVATDPTAGYAGGFIGQAVGGGGGALASNITNSTASGNVTGSSIVGGFIGDNNGGGSFITGSQAFGNATATANGGVAGGFAGQNSGAINRSQAFGDVFGSGGNTGAFVGANQCSLQWIPRFYRWLEGLR